MNCSVLQMTFFVDVFFFTVSIDLSRTSRTSKGYEATL